MNLEKKIARIKTLISRLTAGETISTRSLTRVLTESQLEALNESWLEEKSQRKVIKPHEIKKYESMVKTAVLLYSRAEQMSDDSPKLSAMYEKADNAFCDAIEFLQDSLQNYPDLHLWIDRDIQDATCHPIGIPRVIGSSSFECQDSRKVPYPTHTKRELKILALEEALEALESKPKLCWQDFRPAYLPQRKELCTDGFKF